MDRSKQTTRSRGATGPTTNGSVKPSTPRTDLRRWRLKDVRGEQTWHYLERDEDIEQWPMSVADKYFVGLETVSNTLNREQFPARNPPKTCFLILM